MKCGYVAIVGEPNAGKSTLLNALLDEQVAIVTPKPQTTRHRIVGIVNREDAQLVFLDSPGFHHSKDLLNKTFVDVVDTVIKDADAVCLVLNLQGFDESINKQLYQKIKSKPHLVVLNKADKVEKLEYETLAKRLRDAWGVPEILVLCALRKLGTQELVMSLLDKVPEGPPLFPQDILTEHSLRFLASELIREQVFLQMHEEIPYSSTVEVEKYIDPTEEGGLTKIHAAIVVEREAQKGMIIGQGGKRIKEIGVQARKKIERLTGGKVFLKLYVKVDSNWSKNPSKLREFGYGE